MGLFHTGVELSLILTEGHNRFRMFENKEVTGGGKKYPMRSFIICISLNIVSVII